MARELLVLSLPNRKVHEHLARVPTTLPLPSTQYLNDKVRASPRLLLSKTHLYSVFREHRSNYLDKAHVGAYPTVSI